MPQPASHLFHVVLRCDGVQGELQDFKMPLWHPGYYRIIDYTKNVSNFRAEDGAGHSLGWEKATRNTWRVAAGNASTIILNYDVLGTITFGAQNFLGEKRAYIAPTGMFVHLAGKIQVPATVTLEPPAGWRIAVGLDPVAGRANTFTAPDFDLLYDCPMLLGNQERLAFDVDGVPHDIVIENIPDSVNRDKIRRDLSKIVRSATHLIGDIPYRHYTFLLMGEGNGGIEHSTSASISFNGKSLTTDDGYRRWLSFVAHEYFHTFNVKRIRPIALGPFDYETENLTNMLWVSEGLSVYYQDLLTVRAGLVTRDQYLAKLEGSIAQFENMPGRRYQSATESSWNTWGTSGVGNDRNTTISYYNNGGMLGFILDLAIRRQTNNSKSLDDVMRGLYRKYYQQKKRGFTDAEFRAECEAVADGPLDEVFEYASTTKEMAYGKYLAYAGLEVSVDSRDAPGAWLGVDFESRDGKLVVEDFAAGSPARAVLRPGDQIVEAEGSRITPKALNDLVAAHRPGDKIKVKMTRGAETREVELELAANRKFEYDIHPAASPGATEALILRDWLRTDPL